MSCPSSNDFTFHTYSNKLSIWNKAARLLWNVYAALFFRTLPTRYLNFARIAGLRLFGAKIGSKGVSVHRTVRIWAPWNLVMENFSMFDRDCYVYNPAPVILRSETVVSENVHLCSASHDVHSRNHELITKPITLEGKNWVAIDSLILPGVTIGEGSVVGAGAVVAKSVGEWVVVAGNPAKVIKTRDFYN